MRTATFQSMRERAYPASSVAPISRRASEIARVRGLHGRRRRSEAGCDGVIELSRGFPTFDPPQAVFEAMHEALSRKDIGYTDGEGLPGLREAIADKLSAVNRISADPDREIIVTVGSQEALMTALMVLVDPGDEVITPTPHYVSLTSVARAVGARLVEVPTFLENGFVVNPEDLVRAITRRTRAILLVTPNNPTGTVLTRQQSQAIADVAQAHGLVVVSDELYENFVYEGNQHVSMAALPGMHERTITISGLSKGFGFRGLRLGYLAAPADLVRAMLPIHHDLVVCAPVVSQFGAIAALRSPRDWLHTVLYACARHRGSWLRSLDDLGLARAPFDGAFFPFFDVSSTGLSATDFVHKAYEVAGVQLSTGGLQGPFVRGSVMASSEEIETGLARLTAFVETLT